MEKGKPIFADILNQLVAHAVRIMEDVGIFTIEDGVVYQSLSHWGLHPVANLKYFEGI